ncbi:hypothetical protein AB6A23_18720 [Paenibacillus tarimensis]
MTIGREPRNERERRAEDRSREDLVRQEDEHLILIEAETMFSEIRAEIKELRAEVKEFRESQEATNKLLLGYFSEIKHQLRDIRGDFH